MRLPRPIPSAQMCRQEPDWNQACICNLTAARECNISSLQRPRVPKSHVSSHEYPKATANQQQPQAWPRMARLVKLRRLAVKCQHAAVQVQLSVAKPGHSTNQTKQIWQKRRGKTVTVLLAVKRFHLAPVCLLCKAVGVFCSSESTAA